jgi:hypothetical protein
MGIGTVVGRLVRAAEPGGNPVAVPADFPPVSWPWFRCFPCILKLSGSGGIPVLPGPLLRRVVSVFLLAAGLEMFPV